MMIKLSMYDWLMEAMQMKEELKYFLEIPGALFVMMAGILMMPM